MPLPAKAPYAICRIEKLHARDLSKAAAHNYRARSVPNAKPSQSGKPEVLYGAATADAFLDVVEQRIKAWQDTRPRTKRGTARKGNPDPVQVVEVLLTASPEYFRPEHPENAGEWDEERAREWFATATRFAREQFGANLVSVCAHRDEATPHIHLHLMPFDESGQLNCKKLFNRRGLIALQDAYASACAPLGLQRGRRGSTATHEEIKTFYGAIRAETPAVDLGAIKPVGPPIPGKLDRMDDQKLRVYAAQVFRSGAKAAEKALGERVRVESAKAAAFDALAANDAAASNALRDTRKTTAELRTLALSEVLSRLGARKEGASWRLPGSRLTVDGAKFYDHERRHGGGGAIDLVMHAEGVDFRGAVQWLTQEFGRTEVLGDAVRQAREDTLAHATPAPLPPPARDDDKLPRVVEWLTQAKGLAREAVESLIQSGKLYADRFANAVFAYRKGEAAGAEVHDIREAIPVRYRGARSVFAPFPSGSGSEVVFVDTALDALGYRELHPGAGLVVAVGETSREDIRAYSKLLKGRGARAVAAFGRTTRGEALARLLAEGGGEVERALCADKDWSEALRSSRMAAPRRARGPRIGM